MIRLPQHGFSYPSKRLVLLPLLLLSSVGCSEWIGSEQEVAKTILVIERKGGLIPSSTKIVIFDNLLVEDSHGNRTTITDKQLAELFSLLPAIGNEVAPDQCCDRQGYRINQSTVDSADSMTVYDGDQSAAGQAFLDVVSTIETQLAGLADTQQDQ